VSRRVGACWALLGLSARLLSGLAGGEGADLALGQSLVHFVGWGLLGMIAAAITDRAVDEAFRASHPAPATSSG
jgi:hypothetical protein